MNYNIEGPAIYIIDGNSSTFWHSKYNNDGYSELMHEGDPYQITIDLKTETTFRAFSYMPRQFGENWKFRHYEFYVAQTKDELDAKILNSNYSSKGDINYTSILSTLVIFPYPETGRYISLRSYLIMVFMDLVLNLIYTKIHLILRL